MTWNYRIIVREVDGENVFGVHEVYYENNDTVRAWVEDPVDLSAESYADLTSMLESILRATELPVLVESCDVLQPWIDPDAS